MIDEEKYEYREDEEEDFEEIEEPEEIIEKPQKEILTEEIIKRDPKYFYFIDKEGNKCRILRSGNKKSKNKKTITNYFDKVNLSIPKIMLNGYVSKKFKTVRRTGKNGAYIWVPPTLIGQSFQMILIPKEDVIVNQIMGDYK